MTNKLRIPHPLISVFLALVTLAPHFCGAQGNNSANILPLCGSIPLEQWFANDPRAIFTDGETDAYSDTIGRGFYFDCAAQLRLITRQENGSAVADHLEQFSSTQALPNTINPAAGNGQIITLSAGANVVPTWPGCLPVTSTKDCPPATYLTNGFPPGTVYYRRRGSDGTFKGGWTVAVNSYFPGFTLRRMPSCATISASTCDYEIVFPKDYNGAPTFGIDTQVVLKVGFIIRVSGDLPAYNDVLGIPLFISSSSGSSPKPGTNCVVPSVASLTLAAAKTAIKAAGCLVGTVTKSPSKAIARGAVISTSPKAGRTVKLRTKVQIKVSSGKPKKRS